MNIFFSALARKPWGFYYICRYWLWEQMHMGEQIISLLPCHLFLGSTRYKPITTKQTFKEILMTILQQKLIDNLCQ